MLIFRDRAVPVSGRYLLIITSRFGKASVTGSFERAKLLLSEMTPRIFFPAGKIPRLLNGKLVKPVVFTLSSQKSDEDNSRHLGKSRGTYREMQSNIVATIVGNNMYVLPVRLSKGERSQQLRTTDVEYLNRQM